MGIEKKEQDRIFGHRLKVLLDLRKLNQVQFAARLGISETHLSLIIHGKRGMSKTKKLKAAPLLDVHPFTLTSETEIPDDKLLIYDMFVRMLISPDDYKSYPSIETLIKSEFSK